MYLQCSGKRNQQKHDVEDGAGTEKPEVHSNDEISNDRVIIVLTDELWRVAIIIFTLYET